MDTSVEKRDSVFWTASGGSDDESMKRVIVFKCIVYVSGKIMSRIAELDIIIIYK